MASIIPLDPAIAYQRVTTTLGTYPAIVSARWNDVMQLWAIDVHEIDDRPIVTGELLVLGARLGRRSTHQVFTGTGAIDGATPALFAWLLSGTDECRYDDLGGRVVLVYMDELDTFLARTPVQRAPASS